MFPLFSVSAIEIVFKDVKLELSKRPIEITIEDLEAVNKEWEAQSCEGKIKAHTTFLKHYRHGKMDKFLLILSIYFVFISWRFMSIVIIMLFLLRYIIS